MTFAPPRPPRYRSLPMPARILPSFLTLLAAVAIAGCVPGPEQFSVAHADLPEPMEPHDGNIIRATELAVDQMMATAAEHLDRDDRILVATFVDGNDLTTTSGLGRLSRDIVEGRLSGMGYKPRRVTLRQDSIAIVEREGEFLLSRDRNVIGHNHEAEALVVGTYIVAGEGVEKSVYCSVRIINAADNSVIGSHDYELPVGPRTSTLLGARYQSERDK